MSEIPVPRAPIDVNGLQAEATAIVARLIGQAALDTLVQAMLDCEVAPVFLWRDDYPSLAAVAAEVDRRLAASLGDLTPAEEAVIRTMVGLGIFDSEPAKALLEGATALGYFAIPTSVLELPARDSRVLARFPGLADRIDDRGLLPISGLEAQPDVLFVEGMAVPYHQLLRRGFGSHVNDVLIGSLMSLAGQGHSVSLAIDERRLHPRSEHLRIEERDYWGGPPLTFERLDDPNRRAPEILQHGWPVGAKLLPWEIDEHVSVRTKLDGARRTIEIEEVTKPSLESHSEYQLVRYAHAERDITSHTFTHLDGAVRFYDRGRYEARRDERWPTDESNSPVGRRKVFRVDGDLTDEQWLDTVALWFRGNRLIWEALAIGDPEA